MSLRMPQTLSSRTAGDAAFDVLGAELAAEKATNLGRMGRAVEAALLALANTPETLSEQREARLSVASTAVWRYFVQREMCGLLDHTDAIALYGIPQAVLNRLGSTR